MRIWKKNADLGEINALNKNCLVELLGIEIIEMGDDYMRATMPADKRTYQPMGILHGGASVVLAESIGSIAANMAVDSNHYCVGLEVNANHLKSVSSGIVTATVRPVHLGKSTHVWDIEIVNEHGQSTCVSRLTMAVLRFEAGM